MSHPRKAFTLIELLVVVAIIALLISILLPSLSKARETARMVKCLAIQKQYGTANIMYANSHDQWYVQFNAKTSEGITKGGGFWGANVHFRQNLGLRIGPQTCTPELICPSKQPASFIETGQWYRAFAMNMMGGPGIRTSSISKDKAVFRSRVRNPATKVMGMDATNWNLSGSTQADPGPRWDIFGDTHVGVPNGKHVAYRHLDQTTALMHDGHAQNMPKGDAYRKKHSYRISLYDPYKN